MTRIAIVTENLARTFGSVVALDGLSLKVESGTIFGFLGPNGAGKTTTIRLLLGLLEPTDGRATVLGHDTQTQAASIREKCGALLEHTGLYERLTALDNLEFYGRAWNMPSADRAGRIKELLTHFGLWERRKEGVSRWSRGMKQKLALARVLLHRPALIFLDEPTSGLDPVAAAALRDDLSALVTREGTTVFLTTHNLNESEKLCSRVAVIRNGKLLAVGHPAELRTGEPRFVITGSGFTEAALIALRSHSDVISAELQGDRLRLSLKAGCTAAPLVTLLVEHGAVVEEVTKQHVSLEDTFLALVEDDTK